MDASLELLTAALARLRTTTAVTDFVGQHIYDRVPEKQDGTPNVPFPYISVGPSSSTPDDFDCMDGEEITIQFDVWTSGSDDAYGSAQCRKIAGAVKRALHGVDLALTVNALVSLELETLRIIDDPNPAISHGVVTFTATVETP
jgi:hypothetical protein